jgi:hypothetical protein
MKRKRGAKQADQQERLAFEAWASSKQIKWHDALALRGEPGVFRIVATRKIGEGEQILRVPTSAIISLENSSIATEVKAMKSSGVLLDATNLGLPESWMPGLYS